MAWIKVETTTPDKPEIRHIARACGVSGGEAFAAWFRLWAWFDSETADGQLPLVTKADCDDVAGLPGIGDALEQAGWVEFHAGGALVIKWDTHNGSNAKLRAVTAKRVNRHRQAGGCESGYRPWRKKL